MPPSVRNIRPPSCGRRFRYFVITLASVLVALLLLNGNRPYCFGVSVTQLPQRARVVSRTAQLSTILAVNEAEHLNRRRSNGLPVRHLAIYLLGLGGLLLPSTVPTLLT